MKIEVSDREAHYGLEAAESKTKAFWMKLDDSEGHGFKNKRVG